MPTTEEIADAFGNMTIMELVGLTKTMEETWGVKVAPPPVVEEFRGAPAYWGPPEEQMEFSVMLVSAGEKKIEVIKVVRAFTGLGLAEVKTLVESVATGPKPIKGSVSKVEAEEVKRQLETAGAKVELH